MIYLILDILFGTLMTRNIRTADQIMRRLHTRTRSLSKPRLVVPEPLAQHVPHSTTAEDILSRPPTAVFACQKELVRSCCMFQFRAQRDLFQLDRVPPNRSENAPTSATTGAPVWYPSSRRPMEPTENIELDDVLQESCWAVRPVTSERFSSSLGAIETSRAQRRNSTGDRARR